MTTDFIQHVTKIQSIQSIQFHIAGCFVTPLFRELIVYYYYFLDMALLLLDMSKLYEVKQGMIHFHWTLQH